MTVSPARPSDYSSPACSGGTLGLPFFSGTKPPGTPNTSVLPAFCAAASDCIRRRFISAGLPSRDRKSTRLNSSHLVISYAVFCLKKKKKSQPHTHIRDISHVPH